MRLRLTNHRAVLNRGWIFLAAIGLVLAFAISGCATNGPPLTEEEKMARRTAIVHAAVEEVRLAREAGIIRGGGVERLSDRGLRVTYGLCATMRITLAVNATVDVPPEVPQVLTPFCASVGGELARRAH